MAELIDVLDENGLKTGEVVTREEVHRQGLWHRIATVAVIDGQNRILLQQRASEKATNPDKWDITAAGHVDAGESALLAITRETSEEVGITAEPEDFQYLMQYRHSSKREVNGEQWIIKHICDCYLLRRPSLDPAKLTLQAEEVQTIKLCTLDEFRQLIASGTMVNRQTFYDEIIRIMEEAL